MKHVALMDRVLEEHLATIAQDGIDRYVLEDKQLRLAFVHGTALVNRMRANHAFGPAATRVMGEAYLLALLAAATLKESERLSLIVETDGELPGLVAEANQIGHVRGYLRNEEFTVDAERGVYSAFGRGFIGILRVAADGQSTQGQIEWAGGDLVGNMARYYAHSEQTATVLDVGIYFDPQGRVAGAAGMMLQALPGAPAGLIERASTALAGAGRIAAAFASGATASDIVHRTLSEFDPTFLGSTAAEFYCDCSKERFGTFLAALPPDERSDILENGPFPLKTTCHNCNSTYSFPRDELNSLLA